MKALLFILTLCAPFVSFGQSITYQQKLFHTCKVWGFARYYHSAASTCQVNWDSVLISRLPAIKAASNQTAFNDELIGMLNAAGPMLLATTPAPVITDPALRRNLDFSWINDPVFRSDVKTVLDTIRNNFRPHQICWVTDNSSYTNPNAGYLDFSYDSPMTTLSSAAALGSEWNRLNLMFRYWNILRYFNPYNYVLDQPWDSTLYQQVLPVANAASPVDFHLAYRKMTKELNDAHVQGFTTYPDKPVYAPGLTLTYAGQSYVVLRSKVPPIVPGDVIVSINGFTTDYIEDSLRPYLSAGDSSVFRRIVGSWLMRGDYNSSSTLVYRDSLGINHSLQVTHTIGISDTAISAYYPIGALDTSSWRMLDCNTGYVNMKRLMPDETAAMYDELRHTQSMIIDLRNYPNGTVWYLAYFMYPSLMDFTKTLAPVASYPGAFASHLNSTGVNGNPTPYNGKLILLMNEQTQSHGEYSCMVLEAMPDVVKVGSQTAGADGNVANFRLTSDIGAGFTCLGVFYPNGDSTQRIGIRVDSLVLPTIAGIRHRRDEVFEKAIQIAGCQLTTMHTQTIADDHVSLFPNPGSGQFRVSSTQAIRQILVTDLQGKTVAQESYSAAPGQVNLDLNELRAGLYLVSIQTTQGRSMQKLVIQK